VLLNKKNSNWVIMKIRWRVPWTPHALGVGTIEKKGGNKKEREKLSGQSQLTKEACGRLSEILLNGGDKKHQAKKDDPGKNFDDNKIQRKQKMVNGVTVSQRNLEKERWEGGAIRWNPLRMGWGVWNHASGGWGTHLNTETR